MRCNYMHKLSIFILDININYCTDVMTCARKDDDDLTYFQLYYIGRINKWKG